MSRYTIDDLLESYRAEEEYYLNLPRIKYYTYPLAIIVNILIKLMNAFEGVEYYCKFNKRIVPICEYKYENIYPQIRLEYFKLGSSRPDDIEYCFFGTPGIFDPGIFHSKKNEIKVDYIKSFFEYLYKYRKEEKYNEMNIDDCLNTFLLETTNWQDRIKKSNEMRKKQIQELEKEKEQKARERAILESFKIDRILIYRALVHVINKYEDDMEAMHRYDSKWYRNGNWSEYNLYHTLLIRNKNETEEYSTLVGSDGHFPDEEGLAYVSKKIKTFISLYNLKETLEWILKDTKYAYSFLDDIWNELLNGNDISEEFIIGLLSDIKEQYKKGDRVLEIKR